MGLYLITHKKEREIPYFKIGDLEGVIELSLTLEVGTWIYIHASIVAKMKQQYEGEEHSVEVSRQDLSIEIKDDQDLTKFKQELDENVKAIKSVLDDYEKKVLKAREFIDSYILRQDI